MHHAHAIRLPYPAPAIPDQPWQTAVVCGLADGVRIRLEERECDALVAASCLLAPETGDEVLTARLPDGRLFILAVLTRGRREARLAFAHGLHLESPGDIRLTAGGRVDANSPEHTITTARLRVEAGEVHARAGLCSLLAGRLRAAGDTMEACFSRLLSRLGSSRRIVADHDETQAGSSRLAVTGTALVQAGTINHTAAELARIDAKQVHLS